VNTTEASQEQQPGFETDANAPATFEGHGLDPASKAEEDPFDPEIQRIQGSNGIDTNGYDDGELDPFDPENARLSQDFVATAGVKKLLTSIAVMRPPRQVFFRVHPDPQYHLDIALLELKEDRDGTYMVAKPLQLELALDVRPVTLLLAVTRQQIPFLWPIRLPREGERGNKWWDSAREAAQTAMTHWVRIEADMRAGAGRYEVYQAADNLVDPDWPDLSMRDLLKLAFRDRYINHLDHPAVLALRKVG
jgi:hypothetical protein